MRNTEPLARQWRVVLVAPALQFFPTQAQLADFSSATVTQDITILLPDLPQARHWAQSASVEPQFCLPEHHENGLLWCHALRGATFTDDLLIYLAAQTCVPHHWDARLIAAHQRCGERAVVSPLAVRHPFLTAFSEATHKPGLAVDAVDQWLNDYSQGREIPVPVVSPSCFLLPGSIGRDLSITKDEELPAAIRALGGETVACTQLYLDDSESTPCIDVAVLPQAYREAFTHGSALTAMRHALTELSARREAPAHTRKCLPVQLHVGHSWGGGLARWIEDYTGADHRHRNLVLRSLGDTSAFGQSIGLFTCDDTAVPIKSWPLAEPILSVHGGNLQYRAILQELIEDYGVESLIVSSLIGHSLDLLRTGLPTTVILHEFFPFCPALYATFDTPCVSCDEARLANCLQRNPRSEFFKFEPAAHWAFVRNRYMQLLVDRNITVVAPDQSVVDRYTQLEPRLRELPLHVIPHGLDRQLCGTLSACKSARAERKHDKLQLVMLGRLTQEKGGQVLRSMLPELGEIADVYLLGTGDSGANFEGVSGVKVVRAYTREELSTLLLDIQPDMGLLLSTVPETFSYTLSELWAAGIPVLATRLGAFAERIDEGKNGWLVEPDAASVLAQLRKLHNNAARIDAASSLLQTSQPLTSAQMVDRYADILPDSSQVPLARYDLPRRSYVSPYRLESDTTALRVVGGSQQSYREALSDFLLYSARKAEYSPKLGERFGAFIASGLRWAGRSARPPS